MTAFRIFRWQSNLGKYLPAEQPLDTVKIILYFLDGTEH